MNNPNTRKKDTGGGVVALVLLAVGALVLYDTRGYGDPDSAVFPRTVAIVLMALSAVTALRAFIGSHRGGETAQPARGSWTRRILLPLIMLGPVLVMGAIGFIPAMLIMFAGLLMVANHDGWTARRAVVYLASGTGVVVLFYLLFRYWLLVPLP
ncbi:MAG: tripartite tricarboxylate transporter TctB family protein [Proteobacteria bacterium]|nr:MAG: tripartite tricarboxylate transporter TctB family protein [Pseudomonadota bacterium]